MAIGYQEVRAYVNEDVSIIETIENAPNITTWTLVGHLYAPDGTEIVGAVSIAPVDYAIGQFAAQILGQTLAATTYYGPFRWSVYRTDTGFRTLVAFGTLDLTDPSTSPPN